MPGAEPAKVLSIYAKRRTRNRRGLVQELRGPRASAPRVEASWSTTPSPPPAQPRGPSLTDVLVGLNLLNQDVSSLAMESGAALNELNARSEDQEGRLRRLETRLLQLVQLLQLHPGLVDSPLQLPAQTPATPPQGSTD